jgi:hypothetical protein
MTPKGADWIVAYEGEDCRMVSQHCQPGRSLHAEAHDCIGKPISELIGPEQGAMFCAAMRRAVETGVVQVIVTEFCGRTYQSALTPDRHSLVREITKATIRTGTE